MPAVKTGMTPPPMSGMPAPMGGMQPPPKWEDGTCDHRWEPSYGFDICQICGETRDNDKQRG